MFGRGGDSNSTLAQVAFDKKPIGLWNRFPTALITHKSCALILQDKFGGRFDQLVLDTIESVVRHRLTPIASVVSPIQ